MSDEERADLPDDEQELRYPQIVRFVTETPWAILDSTYAEILDFVRLRAEGHRLTAAEVQARIGGGPGNGESNVHNGVAVIPLFGVITPRASLLQQISGGASSESFVAQLRAAAADPAVKAMVMDVNSPGGSCAGLPEAAAAIRALRGTKPMVAISNQMMCSAAYYLACQADEIVGSPSSLTGSIGSIMSHEDLTGAAEKAGLKVTMFRAGKFKGEDQPWIPLTDEAKAAFQTMVEDFYGQFVSDVARGRGVSQDTVRNGYGEGRALTATRALKAGLIDSIGTLEDTVARLANGPAGGRRGASSFTKAQIALPALADSCSREDALYSMALLMGGRGAAAFTDLPDVEHRALFDLVSEAYTDHGLEPPEYDRDPDYSNVAFRQDEREVFADRYLRKALATVTAGASGFRGQLSTETADAARAAVRELTALTEGRGSTPGNAGSLLASALADLRRATDLINTKGA